MMFTYLKDRWKNLGLSRFNRIELYLENLESSTKIVDKKDQQFVNDIKDLINDRFNKLKGVYSFNMFLYFGIYFSFFSFMFTEFLVLTEFANFFGKVIGFFGTTILFILLFFSNKIKELYYQDLQLLTSHLISIYDRVGFKDEKLFDDTNSYNIFIKFFKKRGF